VATDEVRPSEAVDREDSRHLDTADVRLERTSTETWTLIHFKVDQ